MHFPWWRNAETYAIAAAVGSAVFSYAEARICLSFLGRKNIDRYMDRMHDRLQAGLDAAMIGIAEIVVCSLTLLAGGLASYLSAEPSRSFSLIATALHGFNCLYSVFFMYPLWDSISKENQHGVPSRTAKAIRTWNAFNVVRVLLPLIVAGLYVYSIKTKFLL
jgi:hypothetical protein